MPPPFPSEECYVVGDKTLLRENYGVMKHEACGDLKRRDCSNFPKTAGI